MIHPQTASIVAAFPYTIFLCMLCGSIWRGLEADMAGIDYDAPQFSIGLLDFVTTWQVKREHLIKRSNIPELLVRVKNLTLTLTLTLHPDPSP